MHRSISYLMKGKGLLGGSATAFGPPVSSSGGGLDAPDNGLDTDSKVSTVVKEEPPLPVPSLKVKRVDCYHSRWAKGWRYRNMSSKVTVETIPMIQSTSNSQWKDYSFVIVRTIPQREGMEPTFKFIIMSEYILKACKDVIQSWPGISWNSDPLELNPEILLTFYPSFLAYRSALLSKKHKTLLDTHLLSSVSLLTSSIATDFSTTLATVDRLTAHGEITFQHLYALFTPRSTLVTRCAITGLPRLFHLVGFTRGAVDGRAVYLLDCESVDLVDRAERGAVVVGRTKTLIIVGAFEGTTKIESLDAYPLKYHPDPEALKESVMRRGRKWVGLIGVHHMQYSGVAALKCGADKLSKHNVKGRIMVDRATFRRLNPNYTLPLPVPPKTDETAAADDDYRNPTPPPATYGNGTLVQSSHTVADDSTDVELSDEDLLLTPTVVFGFSLNDKLWLEFSVEAIQDVDWNTDAFANLVLPSGRKQLLQALVEAHHREIGFDDFIKGKGHGLVINLFGPPGVGKTFSAEATSEHVKRPLYVIGGGDLGTNAADLDATLEKVFDIATAWKAIVLIDEADVFLEQRSLHDLERNAMVAVFLRHVEYYRGILFLTTNRVKAFDDAFLSRIHVALHFRELTQESKEQVWAAFIARSGAAPRISREQVRALAARATNGRQIKNAARTAQSLAAGRGERLGFGHFAETLDALDEFTKEFEAMRAAEAVVAPRAVEVGVGPEVRVAQIETQTETQVQAA